MRAVEYRRPARADVQALLRTSGRMFGPRARQNYKRLLDSAINALRADPKRSGVKRDEGLAEGVHLFHLRHARTRGVSPKQARHIIVFTCNDTTLTILRVLHDSMDITQRVTDEREKA